MRCEQCNSDNITEDEFRGKPRYTCRCGYTWGLGDSKEDSVCDNCGWWQHPDARKRYWQGIIGCWYCGKKKERKRTNE